VFHVQAETRSLTQLFQPDIRYVIPLYQRPYVWSEDRQWAPLWEDISTIADHVVEDGATSTSPSHFLGAIVIQQQDNAPGTPQEFLVIDGQQRLTTLQLLLKATSRCAEELDCADQAKLLKLLVYNNELLAQGTDRFKVWPTNSNRPAFQLVMDPAGDPDQAADDPINEIQEAFTFFRDRVRDWATADGVPVEERLTALRVTLSDLLKLVGIMLEDGDNPQVIFETLNARGTPLIALDLLKNSVFLRATDESAETEQLYLKFWAPELDREHWRKERRQGRLFSKNGDLFLLQWLVVELAQPIPATELFKTFQAEILARSNCPPMDVLIPRLCHDAAVVRDFDSLPADTPEGRFFERLDLLDTTTMLPVALLLFRDEDVDPQRRRIVLRIVEDFLMRRMICGWTTKNYNRLGADLVKALKGSLHRPDEAAHRFLASQDAPANQWPSDVDVREAVVEKFFYGQRRQDRVIEILWEIEKRWREQDSKTEQGLPKPDNLTIEHILPQAWEDHWPLAVDVDDPQGWREQHLHRLGNLTVTTGQLNSSIRNGPWSTPEASSDKRRALMKHSLLRLNSRLAEEFPSAFDEKAIDTRGEQLATEIIALWPGPSAYQGQSSSGTTS
jgi:hypothetical protein